MLDAIATKGGDEKALLFFKEIKDQIECLSQNGRAIMAKHCRHMSCLHMRSNINKEFLLQKMLKDQLVPP